MSVGLLVTGKMGGGKRGAGPSVGAAAAARRLCDWFDRKHGDLLVTPTVVYSGDDSSRVEVDLYAGTEPVVFEFADDGAVTVEANTGWGGPGFHKWLCELIDAVGAQLGIAWAREEEADETGYFIHRDWNKLSESILNWATALCDMIAKETAKSRGEIQLRIGMPLGFGSNRSGGVETSLGVRAPKWFAAAARDRSMVTELIGWMTPEADADCWRDRALAAMWLHVRWCPPRTETEVALNSYVLRCLQAAFDANDESRLPWGAWKELAELNETPIPARAVALAEQHASAPEVGYRRGEITIVPNTGWSMSLPGSMSEDVDPEGDRLWFDEVHTIRFSSFGVGEEHGQTPSAAALSKELSPPAGVEHASWSEHKVFGRMGVGECEEEDGETCTNCQAVIAAHGQFAVCTVTGNDRSITEFAERVCRSIRGPTGDSGQ
ncbi:MAG TPA: hypothetical protein PKE29_04160 [Phycisphaerales bacterium]|nr:hypothetical protein [Phycisphaerales bacterium]